MPAAAAFASALASAMTSAMLLLKASEIELESAAAAADDDDVRVEGAADAAGAIVVLNSCAEGKNRG